MFQWRRAMRAPGEGKRTKWTQQFIWRIIWESLSYHIIYVTSSSVMRDSRVAQHFCKGVQRCHMPFPNKTTEKHFLSFYCVSYSTCLFFTYNDNLSHHRALKQRTWTQSCHSHVIAAKSCAQRQQHAKKDQWPENKRFVFSSIFLMSKNPLRGKRELLFQMDSLNDFYYPISAAWQLFIRVILITSAK